VHNTTAPTSRNGAVKPETTDPHAAEHIIRTSLAFIEGPERTDRSLGAQPTKNQNILIFQQRAPVVGACANRTKGSG
jgi:hypothetical protein